MKRILLSLLVASLCSTWSDLLYAQSGNANERVAIMNGNQVRTVFGNWGVIGQPAQYGHRGAWKNDNNGYLGDVSPVVGVEATAQSGKVFHAVIATPVQRPALVQPTNQAGTEWYTWEPLPGYFNPNVSSVALSTDPKTWPPFWPDKMSDPTDPGWKGSWNGYFGKKINADLETYFVMDDRYYKRYNSVNNNGSGIEFWADPNNHSMTGMGLKMSVRAMQWAQFLAKDNIFWLYEITNEGTTTYPRAVFGMLVGTYVGVTSTENYGEYNDDWSFYDVNTNITYTGDFGRHIDNPLWVGPVGMVGYAFLESPGNPFDGIDNDGDADSSTVGQTYPRFTAASFDSVLLNAGDRIILINDDYSRTAYTIPNVDSVQVHTRGLTMWIKPGRTKVVEGNVITQTVNGVTDEVINPNAYDGVDNDFDGLVDENFYLHYRQVKKNPTPGQPPLIDILRPVRYVNYAVNGAGANPYSMVDERRDDRIDNNNNWNINLDDVGRDGVPGTGDFGEGDGLPTSGYDANGNDTGLPGEPHIDKTDVKESDQIGLTSFFYFAPANGVRLGDDEWMWSKMAPGFFSVPPSIVNNRPQGGEDGDFIYGSGYFPLLAKATERFSLALVYGGGRGGSVDDDIADLLKNKKTVQKIYDANYQFPQPPDRPTLTAVPGDKKVTLYWDRAAEASVDPVLLTKDFEGYKLYKSTSPDFSDIFTITDASGTPQGYRPLLQVDLTDGVKGYYRAVGDLFQDISGYAYYLGDDRGLVHSYVDEDVVNGQRYFYALVAYDRGDETAGILPSENRFGVSILPSGELKHDPNVVVVTPNTKTAGYVEPANTVALAHTSSYGTGTAAYAVLDPTAVTGHRYRVDFLDTEVDGIDNNGNGLKDAVDSTEWERKASSYSVQDLETVSEEFSSNDTAYVRLQRAHLIPGTIEVIGQNGSAVNPSAYQVDVVRGAVRGATPGSLSGGKYTIRYRYYPVFKSPNIQGSPFLTDSKDADAFDGVSLVFHNDWDVVIDTSNGRTGWVGKAGYLWSMSPAEIDMGTFVIRGFRNPASYRIEFNNAIVDTSYEDPSVGFVAMPTKFRVYNETDSTYIKFGWFDADGNGQLSSLDELFFLDRGPRGLAYSWDVAFTSPFQGGADSVIPFGTGDQLRIRTKHSFRAGDSFEFTTEKPKVDQQLAAQTVYRVRAVPNPYVTAASFEPPLNPGIVSGRGERKIEFIHVPANATIRIFTSRGDHVVTLHHDGGMDNGTVAWNLKTSENLDIAYGVYFYVVESPVGTTTGKLAIIK